MFEREAEEYAIKKTQHLHSSSERDWCYEIWKNGAEFGYNEGKTWHYITDKLPPNPKESEDGRHIKPLNYICAYDCGDGDYECDEFVYLGNGIWLGENKDYYPIYAWMDCAVEVPLPPRKENK